MWDQCTPKYAGSLIRITATALFAKYRDNQMDDHTDLLTRLLEYMEDRQDADLDGEEMQPNQEMKFATEIKQFLNKNRR